MYGGGNHVRGVETGDSHLALLLRYCCPIRPVVFASIKWWGDRALDKIHKFFNSTQVLPAAILEHQMLRGVLFVEVKWMGCGVPRKLQLSTYKVGTASMPDRCILL